MQTIIVAVDFSNASIHAIEYSIPLANKLKSDIILVWVDKVSPIESLYPDTSAENRNEAKRRFEEIHAVYSPLMGKNLKMEYKLRKGKIFHEIDALAKSVNAGLIITGSHGISGFEEFWIGSNAFKIVVSSSCPVITIRHDFPIRKSIKRILLPIDSSPETIQKVPFVAEFAKLFKSEVHVIGTHSSHLASIRRLAEKYVRQSCDYLASKDVAFVEDNIVSTDITKDLLQYARKEKIDLIAMVTEPETPVNIILGPHSQQLINHSPIPVLSIHPSEKSNSK